MNLGLLVNTLCLMFVLTVPQQEASDKDRRDPTVGAAGWLSEIILPGTELEGVPIDSDSPMVVRIIRSFPHGDSFRYDIQFHGLEPGQYNLAEWLRRKDGSSTDDLPEINVEVQSLLPPGQIEPNPLEQGILPRLGGYRVVAVLVALLWLAVLLALIFGKRKKLEQLVVEAKPVTFAELLRPRLTAAARNEIQPDQYAELERMLFAFWRKKLKLESKTADAAMSAIKQNETAGPLMQQLETWMHDPNASRDVDLAQLLKPYEAIPVEEVEATL